MAATGKVVHGGGAVVGPGADSTLCKAFRRAAERWCADKGKRNGKKFNDYFFEDLEKTEPDGAGLSKQIVREPAVVTGPQSAMTVSDLEKAWADDDKMSDVFGKMSAVEKDLQESALDGEIGFDAIRPQMNAQLKIAQTEAEMGDLWMRYPDGILDGQVLEIKGPKDTWDPGQRRDYKKINPNKPVIEVSCEACAAPCHDAGNDCP